MKLLRCIRAWIYKRIACRYGAKLGSGVYVNGYSKFNGNTHIGNNCHFNGMKVFGRGAVNIGDNFHSGSDVQIITQNHNYDSGSKLPYDSTFIFKDVVIGKNVWLGNSVILLPGTILGDGVIVQAGAVVHGEFPAMAICGGNPAVVFKYRNKEHYIELDEAKAYN